MPASAAPYSHELQTLSPSPTQATLVPLSLPLCSWRVSKSARTCTGWWRSLRPLMTGTVAALARRSRSECLLTLAMMQWTYLERTCAVSSTVSPLPSWSSPELRLIGFPPSSFIATWKLTLVLVLGFSKTSATVFPSRACSPRRDALPRLSFAATAKIVLKSRGVSSVRVRKSLPFNGRRTAQEGLKFPYFSSESRNFCESKGVRSSYPCPTPRNKTGFPVE